MSNLNNITIRIKSIQNIHKITKAMELVSVSKMRKATEAVLASREYAASLWSAVWALRGKVRANNHPLLKSRKHVRRVLLVAITSDKGLCGSFNSEIIQKIEQILRLLGEEKKVEMVLVGKKGAETAARRAWPMSASFRGFAGSPAFEEVQVIANIATEGFTNNTYDEVYLIYTDFISTIKQRAVIHRLLPLHASDDLGDAETNMKKQKKYRAEVASPYNPKTLFEPDRNKVLEYILPRAVHIQVFQAILEAIASEQASRMLAMKNASDAADDMVDDFKLTFNQLRQDTITREIAEISAGKAVLEEVA